MKHKGDVSAHLTSLTLAANESERAGDVRGMLGARVNLGFGYTQVGAYETAERMLREVLAEAERMGLRDLGAYARQNLTVALARQGAREEARAVLAPALKMAVEGRTGFARMAYAVAHGEVGALSRKRRRPDPRES
jgi:Tfp pilus assembly protein PilF